MFEHRTVERYTALMGVGHSWRLRREEQGERNLREDVGKLKATKKSIHGTCDKSPKKRRRKIHTRSVGFAPGQGGGVVPH